MNEDNKIITDKVLSDLYSSWYMTILAKIFGKRSDAVVVDFPEMEAYKTVCYTFRGRCYITERKPFNPRGSQ